MPLEIRSRLPFPSLPKARWLQIGACALLAAGWSEDVIVQLTTITSAFNVLNRLADAFGLSANEEFFALAGQRLAAKGYGGTAEMLGLAVAA